MGAGQGPPKAGVHGNPRFKRILKMEPRGATLSPDPAAQPMTSSRKARFPVSWSLSGDPNPVLCFQPAIHRSGSRRQAGPEQLVLADPILPLRRQG